jgi:uncharacterized protein DUF6875
MTAPTGSLMQPEILTESLVPASHADRLFDQFPHYEAGMTWLNEFVTQPHPDLGRSGAVCPRLAPAIRANTVWLVTVTVHAAQTEDAVATGGILMELFAALATGTHRATTALLGFFPDLPAADAADFIDVGHRLLRPEFVHAGLMLGEFHPASTVGSVHNRNLPVMRCPVPMYAIRTMTPHDLVFAEQPATPPADRVAYLEQLGRHVGSRLTPAVRDQLRARLTAAREALNSGELL